MSTTANPSTPSLGAPFVGTPVVEVQQLAFGFRDGTEALRGVTFRIDDGECVALIGPNGAGKSTLLLHLNGILPEGGGARSGGEVRIGGRKVEPKSLSWVRSRVGLLFQDPDDQLFCATVAEDVAFGPSQFGLPENEVQHRVRNALAMVGLGGYESRQPHRLSGGEKKRACLAGLVACEPNILVLDEPTAGLDPRGRRQLLSIIKRLPSTKLIATHDLAMVAELCPRVLVLDQGELVADGPAAALLGDDALMMAHGLECPRRDLSIGQLSPR